MLKFAVVLLRHVQFQEGLTEFIECQLMIWGNFKSVPLTMLKLI